MSLTLDQIKQQKKYAENAIKDILKAFESNTGITDYSVNVDIDYAELENGKVINTVTKVNISATI